MRQKGLDGEKTASDYLEKNGYRILARNFHSRFGEVDIVASDGEAIVFVEVKLRSSNFFGTPLESITPKKLEKIKKTALFYLTASKMANFSYRIDAIEVNLVNGVSSVNHVKNITL